jgi:CRP/FNR family transcriptional regulator, dissimilatory nitrate respiration regulator
MDIILDGQVAVQKIDEEGNVLTIHVFSARDILGPNLIFSTINSYPMTVVSKTDAVILHLYKELILELGQNNLGFMVSLLRTISDRMVILTDKISSISHKTIRQQIIAFLTYEYHIQKTSVIKLNYSKKDLAERLGIQRSSLSRELNKMRRDGLLEYNAKTITLKNIEVVKG